MRQRFRWSFGILQAVFKHRQVFARKGVLGWVALPNVVVFQILLPSVSPFIDFMFAWGALWYFAQKHYHPESTDPASFQRLVIFFAAFLIIDFLTSAIAFALERQQLLTLVKIHGCLARFGCNDSLTANCSRLVLFKTFKRASNW